MVGTDTGSGARASLQAKQTVGVGPLDERLAWMAARHPVVRRLVLHYALFAIRCRDLHRTRQLLDHVWFVRPRSLVDCFH
jgi:hypothetical protein